MEYMIDCSDWNRENLIEVISALSQNTNTKIILYLDESACNAEISMEKLVGTYLNKLGVPRHLKGYNYLKYGIVRCLCHSEEMESVTKILYPEIAKKYSTTSGRVEHGIRNAIHRAWEIEKTKEWENVFGKGYNNRNLKPTNSQFIAALSDFIKINFN